MLHMYVFCIKLRTFPVYKEILDHNIVSDSGADAGHCPPLDPALVAMLERSRH